MRFLLIVLLSFVLLGCVVYINVPPANKAVVTRAAEHNQSVQVSVVGTPTSGEKKSPHIVEKVATEEVVVTELCDKFRWPDDLPPPPQAEFVSEVLEDRDQYTAEQINEVLLDYVFTLRGYMDKGYRKMRNEYLSYLQRCGYGLDDQLPDHLYPTP